MDTTDTTINAVDDLVLMSVMVLFALPLGYVALRFLWFVIGEWFTERKRENDVE